MKSEWQLQDAKNQFSQVVNDALESGPQWVTRHGKAAVVVLSVKDYAALNPEAGASWLDWMRACPGEELSDLIEDREQEEVRTISLN